MRGEWRGARLGRATIWLTRCSPAAQCSLPPPPSTETSSNWMQELTNLALCRWVLHKRMAFRESAAKRYMTQHCYRHAIQLLETLYSFRVCCASPYQPLIP
uniref:Uncharacterized protein n=1 Tax=Trypanosoma vivax (strain Y486) TaxID=1055687 RepID=G0U8E8_TRYVY|nr:hypothetical protein, unlikely [Trypanosoma vivax Y486]